MIRDTSKKESGGDEVELIPVPEIVVLGLGNLLLRDDGVGVHAVRAFLEVCPANVLAVDVGTAVLRAEHLIESPALLIVFDALRAGGAPGSVYATDASGVRAEGIRHSLHQVDLLEMLRTLRSRAPEVLILGAEPKVIDYGCELSASVRAAVPVMIDRALAAIDFWQHASRSAKPHQNGSLFQWMTRSPGVQPIRPFCVRT